jgi:Domain of unknown function (DUF4838)
MKAAGFPVALCVVLAALSGGSTRAFAAMTVFRDGQALMPVLVDPEAPAEERAAATELARILQKMSGIRWPVVTEAAPGEKGFRVGPFPGQPRPPLAEDILSHGAGEVGPDGFRVQSLGGSLCMQGATPEATLFAVEWVLKNQAGVRWYAPGALGEVILPRRIWVIPDINVLREPAYVSREIGGLESADEIEWARHNALRARLEFKHALFDVFSPAASSRHDDWLPELQGRRYMPSSSHDRDWQPNLASPNVAAAAGRAAHTAFALDSGRVSFSLGMNDTVRFDQGPATRKLVEPLRYFRGMPDYSPLVFTFMNRAAFYVQPGSGRYLGCLAYFWCENTPPFPVDPRVVPFVASDRSQYYDSVFRASDLALMTRWGRSGVRAFGLWDYAYGDGFVIPRLPLKAFSDAVREGWRRGARGYFADTGAQWGFDAFKAWMIAQLLWDPERPIRELADDFYPGFYGPAAAAMRGYFEECEALWMHQPGPPRWLKFYCQEDQATLFPEEKCKHLRGLLDEAALAARCDPVIAARVALTSRAFAVTEAFGAFDRTRRILGAIELGAAANLLDWERTTGSLIHRLVEEEVRLAEARERAGGRLSAAVAAKSLVVERNDPVPRLIWLAGIRDAASPGRLLAACGLDSGRSKNWVALAAWFSSGSAAHTRSVADNPAFSAILPGVEEPGFLYPHNGALPGGWELRAMPTETGGVSLVPGSPPAVRISNAWDTQLYQWHPAVPGEVCVATAQMRGRSSLGGDATLFLTFLARDGSVVGDRFMESMPKGETESWREQALSAGVPPDAAWVGVGIGAARQDSGDWVEVRNLDLRETEQKAKL